MAKKERREVIKARSFPHPFYPPEEPERPTPPTWPYPSFLPEEGYQRVLKEILSKLESIEARLERIEKLLMERK